MPLRVLVTGASGFIGQRLVSRLLEQGFSVSVLLRNKSGNKSTSQAFPWANQVKLFEGDITQPEQLSQCCESQDVIIHLAGHAHAGAAPTLHWKINYQGTENLLKAAINANVSKFIYISSSKAKENLGPYGQAKYQAEQLLHLAHQQKQIQACSLRPTAVYGPGMKGNLAAWIKLVKRGIAPPIPPLKTRIAMIGIDDLCAAIITTLKADNTYGNTYQLDDGTAYQIKAIENKIRASLGKAPSAFYLPRAVFWLAAIAGELASKLGINLGFGKNGYNTLFKDEYDVNTDFAKTTGFKAKQNFFAELQNLN